MYHALDQDPPDLVINCIQRLAIYETKAVSFNGEVKADADCCHAVVADYRNYS